MYVPTPSPPTAQAQELGQRLSEVVGQYQTDHPGMTSKEVADAFKIGLGLARSGPGSADASQTSLMAVLLGLAIAGAAAALFMTGGFGGLAVSPLFVVLGVLVVAGAVAALASTKAAGPGTGTQSIAVVIGLVLLFLAAVFFLLFRSGGVPLG